MAKEPVQSVTIQGTAAHFRGIMQRLKILWDGSWTSSTGEVLKFQEERVTQRLGNSLDLDFPRRVDKTSPDRTSWLITSLKPVTEDERQSKIPAIRETFAHGPDDHPENHIQPWKTAGVEAWDLPGGRTQVDFIDAYSPYRQQVAGEALWLPIGPAFVEFSTAVLERPEIVRSQVSVTKRAPEEVQMDRLEVAVKRSWSKPLAIVVVSVLGVVIAIVTNIASSMLPKAWEPYLGLAWPLLVVLVIISIWLVLKSKGPIDSA